MRLRRELSNSSRLTFGSDLSNKLRFTPATGFMKKSRFSSSTGFRNKSRRLSALGMSNKSHFAIMKGTTEKQKIKRNTGSNISQKPPKSIAPRKPILLYSDVDDEELLDLDSSPSFDARILTQDSFQSDKADERERLRAVPSPPGANMETESNNSSNDDCESTETINLVDSLTPESDGNDQSPESVYVSSSQESEEGDDVDYEAEEDEEAVESLEEDVYGKHSEDARSREAGEEGDEGMFQVFQNNSNDSGLDSVGFTNSFLQRLARSQAKILSQRAERRNPRVIKKSSWNRSATSIAEMKNPKLRMRAFWARYVESLPANFFTSKEARLELTTRVVKGKAAYQGVPVTPENNPDMQRIYDQSWRSREDLGQPMGTFQQFRIVVGQYCRFAIAAGMCRPAQICNRGILCDILCSMPAVQAFMQYFEIRSAAGTVMNKAHHLVRLGRYAVQYYKQQNCSLQEGQMIAVLEYLRGVAKVFKTETRRQASMRKKSDTRVGSGLYLPESDIQSFSNKAIDKLNDLVRSSERYFRTQGVEGVKQFFLKEKQIRRKWNLNFLSALMFHGGGQRPQVYTLLEAPQLGEFSELAEEAKRNGVFSLKLSFEKRVRNSDLPYVLFPRVIFRFVKFHVEFVLPALHKKHEFSDGDARKQCLLLHTENGFALSTPQVTACIRKFLTSVDPELRKVSTMTLRASYATMMINRYRRKETLAHLDEEKFLEYLAKLMNTSSEQLRDTYISTEGETVQACAEMITGIMDGNEGNDDSDDDFLVFDV